MNVLKVIDVVDIGIVKEQLRQRFYAAMAERFSGFEVNELFQQLSAWEGEHVRQFQGIRNRIIAHRPQEQYSGEMQEYISVLLGEHLEGAHHSSVLDEVKSPIEAIDIGIGFEKESILLFMELLPYIQESDKKTIDHLINEERGHIVQLNSLRRQLI